ncbi:MAG: 16S rRNA (adenine(1518)-N(6)/adenine(1519)-N(6))-dimethyltransferase RsmA [Myxococcota bacterium]|nr:16S rRNA (adenine(1518)-N(6)/adenine(1519)-N(6))-dimethyltransferase RsmA [Myxococcota bacterium]
MSSRDPRALLRDAGLRPKKAFGQNFLVAEPVARAIAVACVPDEHVGKARIVEIGAGTGALTRWLAERARSVVAIERDRDLVPILRRELAETGVTVLEADAQSADLAALLGDADESSPRILCGNLPYALTGPLLRRAVENAADLERVVFMVQQEVANRLGAQRGTKEWGALTVFVRAAYGVRRVLRATPGAFHPAPDVTSAVIELSPLRPPRARETARFRALVRGAFEQRRKTLRNAWSRLEADGATLERAAARAGVALESRGESLDVESFARMAEALEELSVSR